MLRSWAKMNFPVVESQQEAEFLTFEMHVVTRE
jgi:hypothetical protein